ncbi:MAG: helix-turn-helix domain-containing protein, partial [Bacteroidota bacterium]
LVAAAPPLLLLTGSRCVSAPAFYIANFSLPGFALAYFGMNLAYTLLGTIGLLPAAESFMQGKYFLDKGIELGPDLPESQLQLSYYAFLQDWDLEKTYKYVNKSFELRPTVEFYQSMTSVLVCEGKFDAARNYINTAIQLDPFSSINHHLLGFTYYCEEKYAQAVEYFQKSMELKPDNEISILYLGQALILKGHTKAGRIYFENIRPEEAASAALVKTAGLAMAHTKLGNLDVVHHNISILKSAVETDQVGRAINLLGQCTCLMEDYEAAMFWVEKGVEMRLPLMVYSFVEPMLKPLHQLERFQSLKEQVLKVETPFVQPIKKYKKPLFAQSDVEKYKKQVTALMEADRPYLDPNLSLKDLAEMLALPSNYMSQLLNAGFDQNFSEFINTYRLEEFKQKIIDPQMRHLTILAMAYESGFNSKTVFNNFFKKMTGQTPRAYWKSVVENN